LQYFYAIRHGVSEYLQCDRMAPLFLRHPIVWLFAWSVILVRMPLLCAGMFPTLPTSRRLTGWISAPGCDYISVHYVSSRAGRY